MKLYATKGLRKTTKPTRNFGFKNSKLTQKKRNLQAKIEEFDIAGRNAETNNSRKKNPREEEEVEKNA